MRTVDFESAGVTAKLIADGDRICESVLSGKPFETDTLKVWGSMCQPAGLVIDVGAYTGLFTVVGRLRQCRVVSFEPMPFNRARLRQNCHVNSVSDAVNAEAVSDVVGNETVHYRPIPFTSGASLIRKTGSAMNVPTITIDSLNLQRLDAIKIDVERAEPKVLRGAHDTLQRLRPKLIVEVLDEQRAAGVKEALSGLNYRRVATLDVRNWIMECSQ